jgi:hypothetical protein
VIRILEIEYANHEAYEADRKRWALPANGITTFSRQADATIYKSATIPAETIGTRLTPQDMRPEEWQAHLQRINERVFGHKSLVGDRRKSPPDAFLAGSPFVEESGT